MSDTRVTNIGYDNLTDHSLCGLINISPQIQMAFNIAGSAKQQCLYVTDFTLDIGCVWRVLPQKTRKNIKGTLGKICDEQYLWTAVIWKFSENVGRPTAITVTRDDYVIVVCEQPSCLRIYSSDGGAPVRIISLLSDTLDAPRHAVSLSPGKFGLIHGWMGELNRVCELDLSGNIYRTFGNTRGAGLDQIYWPASLITDSRGMLLVGDRENNRVVLLDQNFKFVRHLVTGSLHDVTRPRRLVLDPINGTLYVGQTNSVIRVIRVAYPSSTVSQLCVVDPLINCYM